MMHHYPDLGSAPDWLCRFNQVSLMALGSDVLSVWNFCTCFLDVILQGNQWFFLQAKVSSAGGPFLFGRGGGVFVDIFFCKIKSSMTFSPKRKEA